MSEKAILLRIGGMTCAGCARHVEEALRAAGAEARVSWPEGVAEVRGEIPLARLQEAVTEAGYSAEPLEGPPESGTGGMASTHRRGDRPPGRRGEGLHVVILGSGSAAFACAIRLAEEGARATLVEAGPVIGGTCVNIGCVPSKFLLQAAHVAHLQGHHPFEGLPQPSLQVNRAALTAQQEALVASLRHDKYEALLDLYPGLELLRGRGRLAGGLEVVVQTGEGERHLRADRILLATGARPAVPPIPGLADTPFWTSTEALAAREVPPRLAVLGGGAVALELAQAYARLGSRVTVLSRGRLLSREDPALGEGLAEALRAEGLEIVTGAEPRRVVHDGTRFRVHTSGGEVEAERLLVATGRRPNTEGLGLEGTGVRTDPRGAIVVDGSLRTTAPGIYAAGDCTTLPQFVYVAAAAGSRAAEHMLGDEARLDLAVLPRVVFTDPQAAAVGLGPAEAERQGLAVESRRLPLDQVPRALANRDTRGFVQLVAEAGSGRLLGAQVLAANAGEVIQAAALAIRQGLTVGELGKMLFPYLTMVEGLRLCAQTFARDVTRLSCCAG